jgi:uncharacterized protein (UPF0548 family)
MFTLRRPSSIEIDRFLRDSSALSLSYGPVGIVAAPPPGFDLDELTSTIGHGAAAFARAREALAAWTHFTLGWLEIAPAKAGITPGADVAVIIRHYGVWSMNGCRIVALVDEPRRFSFSYGTLTNHAERGEELFEVTLDDASGNVNYRIRAASQPRAAIARAGYPLVRVLQARCRRASADAMRLAVQSG